MEIVTREIAVAEVTKWLDAKKVNDKKREAFKDSIETIADAICDGSLSLGEGNVLIHKLKFPVETTDGKVAFDSLEYKPRLKMETIHTHLQNVKSNDADGRVCAYIAALASKPKDLIKKLDTEDYSIGQAIAIFFL